LVSFIDERTFGNLKSLHEQFTNLNNARVFETLKARLQLVCKRTLRRQVLAYVPFTKRHPIVQLFVPKDSEDRLYHLVSEYLRRDNLQALPVSQRSLMTLVLRKLLASSTFAIAGALESLSRRLKAQLPQTAEAQNFEEELTQDFEALDAIAEEWEEEDVAPEPLSKSERVALKQEIADLERFHEGWDVTNLYTIVPPRAANARILIEQSIGQGLRLPYGKRTGFTTVDRLSIVAHDRFQEIIDEANKPDSAIRLQQVILDPNRDLQKMVTVVSQSNIFDAALCCVVIRHLGGNGRQVTAAAGDNATEESRQGGEGMSHTAVASVRIPLEESVAYGTILAQLVPHRMRLLI
jgi:hypothetical protein